MCLGWREWAGLFELGLSDIKAKIDTGARTWSVGDCCLPSVHRRAARDRRMRIQRRASIND